MANKQLIVDSQFSIVSAIWEPHAPETIYSGTLTADENDIRFTTAPHYVPVVSSWRELGERLSGKIGQTRFPVLHGFTEYGDCTLCECIEVARPGQNDMSRHKSITAVSYRSSIAVIGIHIGGMQEKCLESARYSFTGLTDWIPKATTEDWRPDQVVITIPTEAQELVTFCIAESKAEISIKVTGVLTEGQNEGERLNRSVPYVEVVPSGPESLAWFQKMGTHLENFFSLLTGASCSLETMFVYRGEDNAHVVFRRNRHATRFDRSLCVVCAPGQLAYGLAHWLTMPARFDAVESLALVVLRKGKLFVETEFLALAQALEGFHRATEIKGVVSKAEFRRARKLIAATLQDNQIDALLVQRICDSLSHANDPTFNTRLTALCAALSADLLAAMRIDPATFVPEVVSCRNSWTHVGGANSRKPAVSGRQLFQLSQRMRALLRGVMLRHLRIPEEQMKDALTLQASRWG